MGEYFSLRARALVGVRFRAQGRSVETGLDCVGLVLAAFGIPADGVPSNYRLRGDHREAIKRNLERFFRRVRKAERRPGDVLLIALSADQMHLGISTAAGFIHADARIGRVVETPGEPLWPVIGAYRLRPSLKKDR